MDYFGDREKRIQDEPYTLEDHLPLLYNKLYMNSPKLDGVMFLEAS